MGEIQGMQGPVGGKRYQRTATVRHDSDQMRVPAAKVEPERIELPPLQESLKVLPLKLQTETRPVCDNNRFANKNMELLQTFQVVNRVIEDSIHVEEMVFMERVRLHNRTVDRNSHGELAPFPMLFPIFCLARNGTVLEAEGSTIVFTTHVRCANRRRTKHA